jgi:hypothetical protein
LRDERHVGREGAGGRYGEDGRVAARPGHTALYGVIAGIVHGRRYLHDWILRRDAEADAATSILATPGCTVIVV